MKIGEARQVYSARIKALNEQRNFLYEQKKALKDGKIEMTDEEVSELGKAIDRVELSYDSASKTMERINTQTMFLQSAEGAKRQGKAAEKQAEDYSKCLEVARRIARGDKVPSKDEQKLLKFSAEMYQTAKIMAAAAHNKKAKNHKSLWKNGDENQQPEGPIGEVVDDMECGISISPEDSADIGTYMNNRRTQTWE